MVAMMPFAAGLGIEFSAAAPDEVVASMAWRPDLCTTFGMLHGGVMMAMADSVGAVCAFLNLPAGATTSTIESKTNFFRGVREGAVHSTSRPLHVGRTTIVVQTDLADDRGKRVAQVTQTQAVIGPEVVEIGRTKSDRRGARDNGGMAHRTREELAAGLGEVGGSPVGTGRLELIVRRPARRRARGARRRRARPHARARRRHVDRRGRAAATADGSAHPDMQLNIMNARAVAARRRHARALAAGRRPALRRPPPRQPRSCRRAPGCASARPSSRSPRSRTGCAKFTAALRARRRCASSTPRSARRLNLRGINAKVVVPGTIRTGDAIVPADEAAHLVPAD